MTAHPGGFIEEAVMEEATAIVCTAADFHPAVPGYVSLAITATETNLIFYAKLSSVKGINLSKERAFRRIMRYRTVCTRYSSLFTSITFADSALG